MLQRIGAGKYRGQWDGFSWTVSMGNHLWDVVKSPFSMVFHGILGGFEWNTIHGFEELFLTGPYNFHGYVNDTENGGDVPAWVISAAGMVQFHTVSGTQCAYSSLW